MSKPQTRDGINYMLHGCTLKVLTANEIILPTDFVRDLYERPMYSESGGWDKTFRNDAWQGPMWHIAEYEIPGWVGKTQKDYFRFVYCRDGHNIPFQYEREIVRVME